MATTKRAARNTTALTELGATGLKQFSGYLREEWLSDLIGRKGILLYREMRDNDPIVGAIFFAFEMLLRKVSFHMEAEDPDNADDNAAADFLESCIGDMETTWPEFIAEVLSFLHYGWDVHEIVYKIRRGKSADLRYNSQYSDGLIGWRKFAHRGQETLLHWVFNDSGDATDMVQLLPTGGPLLEVPLEKCLHFKTIALKANPEGRSIMRNAYTSYYFKKRLMQIEAVGIERDLTGIPIAWVPSSLMAQDASPEQKAELAKWVKIARDISRNEQEGLVLPLEYIRDTANKKYDFTLLATAGRRAFDTTAIIDRYDQRIAATVLADFITLGSSGSAVGSYAQSKNKTDMFSMAVAGFLDLITSTCNRKAIPDLLNLNGMKGKARLAHGDIQERDITLLSQFVSQLGAAGFILPDDVTEAHLREESGLPPADQESLRDVADGGEGSGKNDNPGPTGSAGPEKDGGTPPKRGARTPTTKRRRVAVFA